MLEKLNIYNTDKCRSTLCVINGGSVSEYELTGRQILGRPSGMNIPDIPVNSGIVSRIHGRFLTTPSGCSYIDEGSTNGTIYNGTMLKQGSVVTLSDGDVMQIHGHHDCLGGMDVTLIYSRKISGRNAPVMTINRPELAIQIRERNVWLRGKKKTLLRDIYLDIPSGSMVLILGGSGAGKTTFMNAVMGYERAEGKVIYDETDIYREYQRMKYEIGYVPQQDLLRMNDTVYDTLRNAAMMRLPVTEGAQYRRHIKETLQLMGLEQLAGSMVGKLSGGQRKRLSIAVEYIGNPSLFFLDEPDSGLDGRMARRLMENLRTIADQGRIVTVISHNPDRAADLFDQVIVLAKDRFEEGRLVYHGTLENACRFFNTDSLEGIIGRINLPEEGGEGKADLYIQKFNERRKKYD